MKQYKKLLSLDDVELEFTPGALEAIANQAIERDTGARGLRSIIEHVMMGIMYEIPTREDVEKVIITKEAVESDLEPELKLKASKKESK